MDTETLAKTRFGKIFAKAIGAAMESRIRYRFFNPVKILECSGIVPGQHVLEVGCGTGYFTIPASNLVGEHGRLTAIDILQESVELVSKKVEKENLKNVVVKKSNAIESGFDAETFDTILLFGVIPAPMLQMSRLLPEMHRILKSEGNLAVWPPVPGWLPQSVLKSGLFTLKAKRGSVYIFQRS